MDEIKLEKLYSQMARMRSFELAASDLWQRGMISGELHLGTGEEAVVAGVVAHLVEGDAMALDHRSTPPLVARGADIKLLASELLGWQDGICRGRGGHMHLFVPDLLSASSGIVGSSGPLGVGFALAASRLRPGKVAVCFFGEGAMNQGMMLESLNLAVSWKLPLVFVCKDNGWAITTRSKDVTSGRLERRARAFGMPSWRVNGLRADKVWEASRRAISRARAGGGPAFILARCTHLDGHFLGDPLLRVLEDPVGQMREIGEPLIKSVASEGATWKEKVAGLGSIGKTISVVALERRLRKLDPLEVTGKLLGDKALELRAEAESEIEAEVAKALKGREGL
ncbi:MAG: thiamine pyrophosphate-dependent dehydrogenase E1 component subunit alpha [Actinomycetota bacterium]|nr:thiamine pyrophosphate-dependent dehydrogenase E1 component subunit alpha [Actinomycetota bacterium]